jgi:sodium-coupled neutral amino acid transporter 11
MKVVARSPFFEPSDPRKLRPMSTPGGSLHLKKLPQEPEHKSTILGASANLIVSVVGAGIVGVPYAIQQSGLVAGLIMTIFVALITDKSLRLLIETAKHIDVPSYEVLYEASFGYMGFLTISGFMFIMSYGAMVSYMMIMKNALSYLLGVPDNDFYLKRAVLVVATLLVLFPLSSQRNMADLAKTSRASVTFYILIVLFVIVFSPVTESVEQNGGWKHTISTDIIKPNTFFTGLGVLSFAYVCQHSSFIIAGSLNKPTKARWAQVSGISLGFSGTLALLMGTFGYLGFLQDTRGNVLENFEPMAADDPLLGRLANVVRVMVTCCMFFVYPLDAFVQRHVYMVLLFKGRQAHEGDDHAVLARRDRRLILTAALISLSLTPALLVENVGVVLAVTGAIAGSFLSYIAPGTAYLAIHGEEFIDFVMKSWTRGNLLASKPQTPVSRGTLFASEPETSAPDTDIEATQQSDEESAPGGVFSFVMDAAGSVVWVILLMPIWVGIARIGQRNLEEHFEQEAIKSPHLSRLGKIVHPNPVRAKLKALTKHRNILPPQRKLKQALSDMALNREENDADEFDREARGTLVTPRDAIGYGTISGADSFQKQVEDIDDTDAQDSEHDPQDSEPTLYDFAVAIGFIVFGVIAMVIGLLSIFMSS